MSRLTYPLTHPSTLHPDAQAVYYAGTGDRGRLYHEPFAAAEVKVGPRLQREAYRPTERFLAAAEALEAHGLGSYDRRSGALLTTRVHPLYTVARGHGMYFASVSLVSTDQANCPSAYSGLLLATFVGADFTLRNTAGAWAVWWLEVLHATATDVEHDDAKVARMIVANPVIMAASGGMVEYAGTLTDARLYHPGTDPLTVADADTTPGVCDKEDELHPFAPYLPPERDDLTALVPSLVTVETYPLHSFEVADSSS
jgi:hypothetical protein